MKWMFIAQFAVLSFAFAKDDVPGWKKEIRIRMCESQASYLQNPETMAREARAKIRNMLRLERARSVREISTAKMNHHSIVTGLAVDAYYLTVLAGATENKVDLSIFLQEVCKKIKAGEPSFEKCQFLLEEITHPEDLRKEILAHTKFLRENSKATGRQTKRDLDGSSINVIDARISENEFNGREFVRDGKRYMRVGYGFWEFISTGKFCLSPSGCEYEIGVVPQQVRDIVTEPEYLRIPHEPCVAQDLSVPSGPADTGLKDLSDGTK